MTKAFLHGRTEAIRSVQPESVDFTRVCLLRWVLESVSYKPPLARPSTQKLHPKKKSTLFTGPVSVTLSSLRNAHKVLDKTATFTRSTASFSGKLRATTLPHGVTQPHPNRRPRNPLKPSNRRLISRQDPNPNFPVSSQTMAMHS